MSAFVSGTLQIAPPIPLRLLGVPLGLCAPGRTPTVKIKLFHDLCCPFSAKMQKVICTEVGPELKKLGEKGETRYDSLEPLFQNVAQPWHPQSYVMNEVRNGSVAGAGAPSVARPLPGCHGAQSFNRDTPGRPPVSFWIVAPTG